MLYEIAAPRIVALGDNLVGISFESMKLLPALEMIRAALASGGIGPRTTVIETTSGTFGLGLALVCNHYGIPLHLVSDPAVDDPLRRRLEELGATVTVVQVPFATGGYQAARLAVVAELCLRFPDHFVPSQYDNPRNPQAYLSVATEMLDRFGAFGTLVGPVGSGGSMCGLTTFLRVVDPLMRAVAVDTHGSVLFGQDDRPRTLRGLGNSIHPRNLDHSLFDEVHWVGHVDAFAATRALHRRHGLFVGPTSGASYLAAHHLAQRGDGGLVGFVLPDAGHRYVTTVHDDVWLARAAPEIDADPERHLERCVPQLVTRPENDQTRWQYMNWQRRNFAAARQENR